jgi:CheY-like chemotaxis protein
MLTTSISPDVPRAVVLDGLRLRQVLLNLLGNAIKFTEAGRVRLTISVAAERLVFEVTDTGPGIETESITKIFAAFAQTKDRCGRRRHWPRAGHLRSTDLADGWRAQSDSVLGEGSRFWFSLPLVEGRSAPRKELDELESELPSFDARLAPGQTVLAMVVDDNLANRHIMSSLLESAGVRVVTAAGGLDAIERARADRPQIIFMDLKMNDLDGFEATRRLASDPATSSIPVVAVTASALGNSRQRARDAGCVDYLTKPVRAELLYGMLQAHAGARFVERSRSAAVGQCRPCHHRSAFRDRRTAARCDRAWRRRRDPAARHRAHAGQPRRIRPRRAHPPFDHHVRFRRPQRAGRLAGDVTVAAPQILLVDDNPTNLQVLYQTLEGQGYRLLAARSGKDAITIAERAAPDLILLDVLMPDIDGYETCARLKADARTRDCAIIFLSALNDARDRAHGLDLGAVDFVNKPFQAEEILARVKTHLTIRELQQQLRQHNPALQHELTVAQELLREARDRTDGVLLGDERGCRTTAAPHPRGRRLRRELADQRTARQRSRSRGPRHPSSIGARHAGDHRRQLSVADIRFRVRPCGHARRPFRQAALANGGTLYIEGVEHLPPEAQVTLVERLRALDASRPRRFDLTWTCACSCPPRATWTRPSLAAA